MFLPTPHGPWKNRDNTTGTITVKKENQTRCKGRNYTDEKMEPLKSERVKDF